MLVATCLMLSLAGACSVLSRSALTWCCILAAGLAAGRWLGLHSLHPYLCVVDTVLLLMMLGNNQPLNRRWQEPVVMIQCGITLIYIAYAVLGVSMLWLTIPFIDVANWAFIVQIALVGLGGIMNSTRNYKYAMRMKNNGSTTPFIKLAWRLI